MTREEKMVLDYFSHMTIVWGIWLIYGVIVQLPSVLLIHGSPISVLILGILFIIGPTIPLFTQQKYFWVFIATVSIPLMFLGILFVQRMFYSEFPINWSASIFALAKGLFSIVYSAQVYGRYPKVSDRKTR